MSSEVVCFRSNISAAGKRRRMRFFYILLGVGTAATLFVSRGGHVHGFVLNALFCFAFLMPALFCYLQATRSVCAVLALKGAKEKQDDKGYERVRDSDELAAQKHVAFTVARDSVAFGVLGAALVSFLLTQLF